MCTWSAGSRDHVLHIPELLPESGVLLVTRWLLLLELDHPSAVVAATFRRRRDVSE